MSYGSARAQALTDGRAIFQDAFQMNTDANMNLDPARPDELSENEILAFFLSFTRSIRYGFQSYDNAVTNIHTRHITDYALALLVAKQQMVGDYQGTEGTEGIVGEFDPRGFYFGMGNGWRTKDGTTANYSTSNVTTTSNNWIHSGSSLLGGTSGNPIQIGKSAVHCIVGYAFYSDDLVRTTELHEQVNRRPLALVSIHGTIEQHNLNYPCKVVETDRPRFLRENTTFLVKVNNDQAPSSGEFAFPLGFTLTTANVLQEVVPGNDSATVLSNLKILTTT